MCIACYLCFIACSLIMVNANISNDLQDVQKFLDQLTDHYRSGVSQQRPLDLSWNDYGDFGESPVLLFGGDKRGGTTQSSSGNIWFGPRLGRKKRRGGGESVLDGTILSAGEQFLDASAVAPIAPQDELTAAGQTDVSNLIKNAPYILVPIIENTMYNQIKPTARIGRSSSENGDKEEEEFSPRHSVRSPPYSPPFSPRLGRQSNIARPYSPRLGREPMARLQQPRLGRQAVLYRRDARSASYQPQQQQQQQHASPVATTAAATTRLHVA